MRLILVLALLAFTIFLWGYQKYNSYHKTKFSEQDRECIRREWRRSPNIPETNDYGLNYSISFADIQHNFQWVQIPKLQYPRGPDILIMVLTRPDSFARRNLIRNSWMSSFSTKNQTMEIVFVLGTGGNLNLNQKLRELLEKEAELYGDLVMSNFKDSYENLSLKTVSSLLFAISKSSNSKIIGKIDEDVLFFPEEFLKMLVSGNIQKSGKFLYGEILEAGIGGNSRVLTPSQLSYRCEKYPEYLSGPLYFMTRDAAEEILKFTKHRNFLMSEDTLITGLLASDIGASRIQLEGIEMYQEFPAEDSKKILAWHAIIYWPTVVDREEILPLATKFFPEYHLESEKSGILGGITTIDEFASIYVIIHICVPIFPVYVSMFVLRHKIVKKLMEQATMLSADAKASHNQILKCLIIQAFIPSLLMIGVTCYILSQLGLITHPFIEYLIFASICTMPMLSPFTYLVYIRPYRTFCMKLLHLQQRPRRYPNTDSNAYFSITRS
ncbi:unnamed protein product [Caenorhabditis nigoni]